MLAAWSARIAPAFAPSMMNRQLTAGLNPMQPDLVVKDWLREKSSGRAQASARFSSGCHIENDACPCLIGGLLYRRRQSAGPSWGLNGGPEVFSKAFV
jgi:hypothetical protein